MIYKIISIKDNPHIKEKAARWFSSKWSVDFEFYDMVRNDDNSMSRMYVYR